MLLLAAGVLHLLMLASYDWRDVAALQNPPNGVRVNLIGPLGAWTAFGSFFTFGVTAYVLPVLSILLAGFLLFQRTGRVWPKAVWLAMLLVALSVIVELHPAPWLGLQKQLNFPHTAGAVGYGLGRLVLLPTIGDAGAVILASVLILSAILVVFRISLPRVGEGAVALAAAGWAKFRAWRKSRMDEVRRLEEEAREVARQRTKLAKSIGAPPADESAPARRTARPAPLPPPVAEPAPEPRVDAPAVDAAPPRPRPPRPPPREKPAPPPSPPAPPALPPAGGTHALPGMELLEPVTAAAGADLGGDPQTGGDLLISTLADFGIQAELRAITSGPAITRYELKPAAGIRVEKITALSNNIALAMMAESVRVQAPIPGKDAVGIEVPNSRRVAIALREVLESDVWRNHSAAIPLALGKDVGGRVVVADLADMPHLLIAGATGSGKTVCMNSLLIGLLMSRTPDQLRLMLVDPKIVEFAAFNHLPHLVVPVITDAKKVVHGLRWAIQEMEQRYKLFAKAGVRNIKAFNSRPLTKQGELFGGAPAPEGEPPVPDRVPYIVIVVDELADLMLTAKQDIENSIARLAQLSRAVGIHLILATQRPSVNVITGTIKANFPARIAFQVAQKVDSRTILDAPGADKLLGKGDLLFLPPGSPKMIRAQGCLTTDRDVRVICDFLRAQGAPRYETAVAEKLEKKGAELPEMEEDDDLLEQSIEIIRQQRRASTSSLQRRLRIGYTRAARIMDLLEQRGIVGPAQGSDPREILVDLDGEIPQNAGSAPEPDEEP